MCPPFGTGLLLGRCVIPHTPQRRGEPPQQVQRQLAQISIEALAEGVCLGRARGFCDFGLLQSLQRLAEIWLYL